MHIYLLMTSSCVETINKFYIINYSSYTYFRTNSCTSFNQNFTLATATYLPGQIRPASKPALKRHKKLKLSLIWLHTGTMVCCTSFNQNFTLATTIYLPGRIRPASKTALKRHKKLKLSLIWLHTGTMVCCTSFNQNFTLATTIYLPGRIRPVKFDRPKKQL